MAPFEWLVSYRLTCVSPFDGIKCEWNIHGLISHFQSAAHGRSARGALWSTCCPFGTNRRMSEMDMVRPIVLRTSLGPCLKWDLTIISRVIEHLSVQIVPLFQLH